MKKGTNWLFLIACITVCVCDFAAADELEFVDIVGTYDFYRGKKNCGKRLNITGSSSGVVNHKQIEVDNTACTSGIIRFVPDAKAHYNWSPKRSQAAGSVLRGELDSKVECKSVKFIYAYIMRPREPHSGTLFGPKEPVKYQVGWTYITFWGSGKSCVYRSNRPLRSSTGNVAPTESGKKAQENTEANSAPANTENKPNDRANPAHSNTIQLNKGDISQNTNMTDESGRNTNSETKGNQGTQSGGIVSWNRGQNEIGGNWKNSKGSNEGPWYWLGPVMGSVATLLAAVITLCTCRIRGKLFQHPIHGAVLPHKPSNSINSHMQATHSAGAGATAGGSDAYLPSVSSNIYPHVMQAPWGVKRQGPRHLYDFNANNVNTNW